METNNRVIKTLITLCRCAVNGTVPEKDLVETVSLDALYELADKHSLTAAAGMALESAGIRDARFIQAVALAQHKNALLDADRAAVLAALEKAGIWYMPLKGVILQDLYPRYGMRQMVDNDILFDAARAADVKKIMIGLGFTVDKYNHGKDDVYMKKPVSCFEMHRELVSAAERVQTVYRYYQDVQRLLVKDPGNSYGYHFTDEDFYLYMVAHEYKHYQNGGIGLRSLLDSYVFLKAKDPGLDWNRITREAEKLGILSYETQHRQLAQHLMEDKPLTPAEQELLEYMAESCTHGTVQHNVDRRIQSSGRRGYFFSRLTLPWETMKINYPVLRKAPVLYPFFWVFRLISQPFIHPQKYVYEVKRALGIGKGK